jgi:hypothetical protein
MVFYFFSLVGKPEKEVCSSGLFMILLWLGAILLIGIVLS